MIHWKERNKQALEMYINGRWNNNTDPINEYLKNLSNCGVYKGYLDKYSVDKKLDYQRMKREYYDDILECIKAKEEIRHKYGKSTGSYYYKKYNYYGQDLVRCVSNNCRSIDANEKIYLPQRTISSIMDSTWSEKLWAQYLTSSDRGQNNLIVNKTKKTFLVGVGLLDWTRAGETSNYNKVGWLYIDAYTKREVRSKFIYTTVFDIEPTWLTVYNKDNFLKDCNDSPLHIDINDITNETYNYIYNITPVKKLSHCKKI